MNKADLVTRVAERSGLAKKDSERAVDAVFDSIADGLKQGEKVAIAGFGAWEVKARAARVGRNPRTGEEIRIGATRVPVFKAGRTLKESV